jgi:ubiquinone/menaquinone biosynthesis C-methylase UbiE
MNDKKHWYDGWFYNKFIDPHGIILRRIINNLIPENSRVIDVGCGTGELAFSLASKCKEVVGVELSKKMIKHAEFRKKKKNLNNVQFFHLSAENLLQLGKFFDYAVTCNVLHEISEDKRIKIIKQMKRIAQNIIISDFTAPLPKKTSSIVIKLIEFLAGKDHYKNHKSFIKSGGIEYYVKKCGYEIKKTINIKSSKIVII